MTLGGGHDRSVAANPQPVVESAGPASAPRRGDTTLLVLTIVAFVVLSLVALLVGLYLLVLIGPAALTVSAILAFIPLAIVVLCIAWIDRWEPEPKAALAFAFLWGAAASVFIALVFDLGVQLSNYAQGLSVSAASEFAQLTVQAPIVEEIGKGFGIVLLFWALRKQFDGPVDGIVYGSMIGVGFAFTENIMYFSDAILTSAGPEGVASIFILRGLMSPFAHVMFTACTGLIMGLASRKSGPAAILGWFALGLVPAIALHAFWNGAAYLVDDFIGYYLLVQVPLFAIALGIVVLLRKKEREMTRHHLHEYAAAGWFTPAEVDMLSSGPNRRAALRWAKSHGIGAPFARFTRDSTRLAFTRKRIIDGRMRAAATAEEARLLAAIVESRHAFTR